MNELPKHLDRLLKLLPLGMDLPIQSRELEKYLGISERTIGEHIRQLIIDYGIPVCGSRSGARGYYLPQNDTERLAGVLPLQRQTNEEQRRINALLNADLQEWRKYRNA